MNATSEAATQQLRDDPRTRRALAILQILGNL